MCCNTKQKIADTVEELLCTQPGGRVTVQQVMELTRMNRQSFYYHYLDINTALKGNDGKLPEADASKDGMHFNKATYEVLVDYLLRHTPL